MAYKLVIEGSLPSLNEYVNVERTNRYAAASLKKKTQEGIIWAIRGQLPYRYFEGPIYVTFRWYCKDKRKDKDNIAFAKKFIFDALQEAERLKNDDWSNVVGFADEFYIDKLKSSH